MTMYDPLHRDQANPGAGKILHAMQSLEGGKKFTGVLHIEPNPIIADKVNALSVLFDLVKLDVRLITLTCCASR